MESKAASKRGVAVRVVIALTLAMGLTLIPLMGCSQAKSSGSAKPSAPPAQVKSTGATGTSTNGTSATGKTGTSTNGTSSTGKTGTSTSEKQSTTSQNSDNAGGTSKTVNSTEKSVK